METDIINLMFDSITLALKSFLAEEVSIILLGMLSLFFTIIAYFKVREMLEMTPEARSAKSAFDRYQANKDDWRAPLLKEDYYEKLEQYRISRDSRDYGGELNAGGSSYSYAGDSDDSSTTYNDDSHGDSQSLPGLGDRRSDDYYKSFT